MASPKLAAGDGSYDFHLRSLSAASRDSAAAADPASDPHLLQSVRMVFEMCKEAKGANDEMVARAFPVMNKLFQRCAAAPTLSTASTGVLLLTILQFFLDFGEAVLHDADGSLKTYFRSCLSREFSDPIVAERTLEFLIANKTKILNSFPTLVPQIRLGPVVDNVIQYNNHVECLDLHLSESTLNSYRGTLPEIIFARFFVLGARVLKEMRFALHLFRKNEWFVYQRRRLQQNGIGSKNAEFHFGTSDDRVIGSHRVNPIHDLSMAGPFTNILRFQN